ncbi:trans-Golgi network integral membrane protein TGN38-like [Maniola jurtina]|uniref:trans-Golgi network integral membrane protein TGN38-like n=1 Tax=Maniola jurtina TaxID=191418 RepID=UPI001E68F3CA|nr:trans-Golgi network integral membrane protein TGN38-like [Maniola jurtina]
MHIFIIALILMHGCHHGTGLPVMPNEIGPLQHLANTCENAFLADLISKKSVNCKISGSVTSPNDLECYMFYDINSQLCAAFQHSEFNLQESYEARMKERLNVATLCDSTKAWKFATIQPNSAYSGLLKVVSDPVICQKLCGVGDILSDDANYFCTYFKWGTEVIQSQVPQQDNKLVVPIGASASNTGKSSATGPSINVSNVPVVADKDIKPVHTKLVKPDVSTKEVNPEKSEQKSPPTSTSNQTSGVEKALDMNKKIIEPSTAPIGVSSVKADIDHPAVEEEPPKKDEVEKTGLGFEESKDVIDDKGKPEDTNPEDDENDNDDYEQHDELPADKSNKNDNGGVESDPEVVIKGNNNPILKIESITYPPQRVPDIFPNGIPDSFTDDDDHFFPIFLTGIIIVVLLYILYHNKSKFTKVILGLIVEGRQSGRRRNSRGHAYRRLDTLEQAMSSSTAAPPSKIIY